MKSALVNVLGRMGYQVHRLPRTGLSVYESATPLATYAPWNSDREFTTTYQVVSHNTLVDLYRCWELWTLVAQSAKQPAGCLLEVGVWRGGTGALISKQAKLCGISHPVFLCDTFRGVVKAGANDHEYAGGEHADTSRERVEFLTRNRLGLDNVRILEGIFPDDTAHLIADETFRFCHIDVDVYQSAKDILDWVWPRLIVGGIVVFDDYGFAGCDGVARFVDDEQRNQPGRVVLHNLNGHAVIVRIA